MTKVQAECAALRAATARAAEIAAEAATHRCAYALAERYATRAAELRKGERIP